MKRNLPNERIQGVLALKLKDRLHIQLPNGRETEVSLPSGVIGVCLVFESADDAREFYGPDVKTAAIVSGDDLHKD